jgi:hypothetical protein
MDGSDHIPAPVALTKKAERYCAELGEISPPAPDSSANLPSKPPESAQDGLDASAAPNVDHTLRDRMLAAVARLEALAEEIVAKLDELEGDPDLEPVLGAPEPVSGKSSANAATEADQSHWARGGDADERETGEDDEPSLGSVAVSEWSNQTRWAQGNSNDAEEEHDGREPDVDGEPLHGAAEGSQFWQVVSGELGEEPSLGSLDQPDQTRWADHRDVNDWSVMDGEEQCEDEGGQCEDEGFDADTEADYADMG